MTNRKTLWFGLLCLGLADNELRVYHGEQRRVRKADDLPISSEAIDRE